MMRSIKKLVLRRDTIRSMSDIACRLDVAMETCTARTRFASTCVGAPEGESPPN